VILPGFLFLVSGNSQGCMEFWFDYTFTQDKNADIRMKQGKKKERQMNIFLFSAFICKPGMSL